MAASFHRAALRPLTLCRPARGIAKNTAARNVRFSSTIPEPQQRRGGGGVAKLISVAVLGGGAYYAYDYFVSKGAQPASQVQPRGRKDALVTAQPTLSDIGSAGEGALQATKPRSQVTMSWETTGVYAWGSNSGKVIDPDSSATVIKAPRRIRFLDGQILRDLKLDKEFGVAVLENGNIVQWGTGFSKTGQPKPTLTGKDIIKVAISADRIIALSSKGEVYSLPVWEDDQKTGIKQGGRPSRSFFWAKSASESNVNYRSATPWNLGWGERIIDIQSGMDHCLMLTSQGRVFSAAASTINFPSKGQLGIPGLTWATKPYGPFDQPHEVTMLNNVYISKIAAGDYHSLVLTSDGQVFSFGDNTYGQLGLEISQDYSSIDVPCLLPFDKTYRDTDLRPRVTAIGAGGRNSYFAVDATKADAPYAGTHIVEIWSCGSGVQGNLGTGKWTHISARPTKVKGLSGLYEFDEGKRKLVPISVTDFQVGTSHASAVISNVTSTKGSDEWGSDVMFWGGNEQHQLGTGKRQNVNEPAYIGPFDGEGDQQKGRFQLAPRTTARLGIGGRGRKASVEQKLECGRYITAVYSGT
jgi:alpha-tubulin suppressor-like RCC1 family protein